MVKDCHYHGVRYKIIFTDISMPVMTGFEMTKQVREFLKDEEHVPIIGITGHATIAYKKLAL